MNFQHGYQNMIPSGLLDVKTNTKNLLWDKLSHSYFFIFRAFSKLLALLVLGAFSHMAYSADPILCTPTNGVIPEIHINANFTSSPAGARAGVGYTFGTPVIAPGPITCPNYTPTQYTVMASLPDGTSGINANLPLEVEGFMISLLIGKTPGYVTSGFLWAFTGNTPNIESAYYPSVIVYPAPHIMQTHDVVLNDFFLGYIELTGVSQNDTYVPTDKTNMTAVYYSGTIHIPPYCQYAVNQGTVNMGTYFAADFANAGAGGLIGSPVHIKGEGTCAGGSTAGDGDIVHLSMRASYMGASRYIALALGSQDIGVQITDDQGNILPVDGTEFATVATHSTTDFTGEFTYPLNVQLISPTGKLPTYHGACNIVVTVNLMMD